MLAQPDEQYPVTVCSIHTVAVMCHVPGTGMHLVTRYHVAVKEVSRHVKHGKTCAVKGLNLFKGTSAAHYNLLPVVFICPVVWCQSRPIKANLLSCHRG